MTLRTTILLLFLVATAAYAQQRTPVPASSTARVSVARSGEDGVTLEIAGLRARVIGTGKDAAITHNAGPYIAHGSVEGIAGAQFIVGVPHDATGFTATVTPTAFDTLLCQLPADRASHGKGELTVGSPIMQRGMRTVSLLYQPIRYEGGRALVQRSAKITLTWKRNGAREKMGEMRRESSAMDDLLRGMIVNYDQAKNWRRASARNGRAILAASGWGMEKGVVIPTGRDGIYAFSGAELRATGADGLIGASIAQLRLRTRSQQVRFYVNDRNGNSAFDDDDVIEFAGRRNPSDEGFYYDAITDTNAYVLSWEGGSGGGPLLAAKSGSVQAPSLAAYDSTLHLEEENIYFPGKSLSQFEGGDIRTIHVTERVENERFYWANITAPFQALIDFNCSPYLASNASVRMTIRMVGLTDTLHSIRVQLNGIDLGTVNIEFRADTSVTFDVPANYFLNGKNTMAFVPPVSAPGSAPDAVYVDYLELAGRWLPTAFDDAPKVRIPTDGPSQRRVAVTGLAGSVTHALSTNSRTTIDSLERGYLFRLVSRQFDPSQRNNPGFVAQVGDEQIASPHFGTGLQLIEVDGSSGAVRRREFFNLYPGDPQALNTAHNGARDFLRSIPNGNIVLAGFAVGGGEGGGFSADLKAEFAALGATRVGGNNFVASWSFAARKGSPATAAESYATLDENNRGVALNAFIPADGGTSYRAIVTVDGAPGEEFQIGAPLASPLRYHGADALTGSSNRADMIIITHPAFIDESNRLAAHRSRYTPIGKDSAFIVRVVDVNTIYDEFNHGVKTPHAIRRFVQYADSNWSAPSPGYVLLVGDASWDPQRRLPSSATIDYVPAMGIPATDYLYSVAVDDSTMTWQQLVGRLPATSHADARAMVDKIIEYDTLPPAAWNKRYVFMAGGANIPELDDHKQKDLKLAEGYILAPTYHGDTAMIWRTSENLAQPDDKDAEWARSEINKGAVWVNFAGHGATDVADLDYGYPEQFNNGNRYFLLATFSCQTGAYAEPAATVRNERFVTYPGKGAVASIGGTSYSYPILDQSTREKLFEQITQPPYIRNIGAIFVNAKFDGMFRALTGGGTDWTKTVFPGVAARNTLMMYNLLGDPSMNLASRSTVELAFTDVKLTGKGGPEALPGDSVATLRARIWNYGVPTYPENAPVTVIATITNKAQESEYDTVKISGLERFADISFELPLGKDAAEYTVRLQADPARVMPEEYLADNDTSFTFRVRGNQVQPIEPVPYGRVAGYDDVVIRLLNPPTGPGAEIVVDTVPTFDSPARISSRTSGTMKLEELVTTWTFSIPSELRGAKRFWWSAKTTTARDSSANQFPLSESFTVEASEGKEFILGGAAQMGRSGITNLVNTDAGVGPGARKVPLLVTSMGQTRFDPNGPEDGQNFVPRSFVQVMVDGKDHNRPPYDGVNLLVLDGVRRVAKGSYAFYRTNDVDAFLKMVIDSIAEGQRVLLWVNGKSFLFSYRGDEIKIALRSLGMSDSVLNNLGEEDSYALIGGKSASVVRENWVQAAPLRALGKQPPFYASISDTVIAPAGSGALVTPTVGPATAWRRAVLEREGNSPIDLVVYGVRRDGVRDSLMRVENATSVDLASVDVKQYPRLEFRADFPNDTLLRLKQLAVEFDPSPEIAIVPSTARMKRDSVMQGDPATFDATIVNLSRKYPADGITAYFALLANGLRVPVDTLSIARLAPLDSVRYGFEAPTEKLRGDNAFELAVNPLDYPAEPYRHNNIQSTALRVGLDNISPSVAIYADDNRLMHGDFVAPRPLLEVRIFDNSFLQLNDSETVAMILDNDIITTKNGATFQNMGGGEHRGTFSYTPPEPLAEGKHEIRLMTVDASGNGDTTEFIEFYVERNLSLKSIVNWPNPFVDKTTFTFLIAGGTTPKSGEIGIYTVAGRKIKTIRLASSELHIGFNRVDWDGLDEDRDRLANGVYLYKVVVDDGETKQEAIEKLVIMR